MERLYDRTVENWIIKGSEDRRALAQQAAAAWAHPPSSEAVDRVVHVVSQCLEVVEQGVMLDGKGRIPRQVSNRLAKRAGLPIDSWRNWVQERSCQHGSILWGTVVSAGLVRSHRVDDREERLISTPLARDLRGKPRQLYELVTRHALAMDTWWAGQMEGYMLHLMRRQSGYVMFLGQGGDELSRGLVEHLARPEQRRRRIRTDWDFNAGKSIRYLLCLEGNARIPHCQAHPSPGLYHQ